MGRGNSKRSMSDAAVQAKTGKTWAEWFHLLDRAGGKKRPRREIVNLLYAEHKVSAWWAQMVTVEYERARGLRDVHQTTGGYVANISRTLDAPVGALYKAWTDAGRRRRWLGAAKFTVSTANQNKNLRMAWGKGSERVEVYFYPKGAARCTMTVQHSKLASANDVAAKKKSWAAAFTRLEKTLP